MSKAADDSTMLLKATYDSPSGHKDFANAISAPQSKNDGTANIQAKTKYLSELRASSKNLQEDINKFLTTKMEEDKKTTEQDIKNAAAKQRPKDELEEENYGEENES